MDGQEAEGYGHRLEAVTFEHPTCKATPTSAGVSWHTMVGATLQVGCSKVAKWTRPFQGASHIGARASSPRGMFTLNVINIKQVHKVGHPLNGLIWCAIGLKAQHR